jgi:hypothetical protein
MTISCPRKALTKTHVAAFVDRPISGETFAKVGVEAFLISACPAAPKCNRVEDSSGILGHK